MYNSVIIGTGSYLPEIRLTNQCLEKIVNTTHHWIMERTGIKERPIAWPWETPVFLATLAAQKALENAKIAASEIDLIIMATVKSDHHFPAGACEVQSYIGAINANGIDVNGGCTGFIHALDIADSAIKCGKIKTALVIGVEKLSDVTDYTDRSTCVLFGDGAGAVVLKRSFQIKNLLPKVLKKYFMPIGILATYQKSDGSHKDKLWCTNEKDNSHFLKMEGNHLFKLAVNLMIEAADKVLSKVKISSKKIDLLFPHQANDRIIMAVAERLKLEEKVVSIISKIGNISSATIPIALDQYNRQG